MNRNDIEVNFEDTDNIEIELKKSFEKYQQGYGIKITGKTISVDNEVIPSKEDVYDKTTTDEKLAEKQNVINNENKLNADLVSDDNSTHKFVSAEEKSKLSGIEAGAEVNVQADWNEEDSSKDGYIKNKPSIPAEQIQADWNQNDNTKKDFIKNKPSVVTTNTEQEITAKKTFNGANVEFKNSTNVTYTLRRNGNVFEILYNGNLVFSINNQIAKAYNLLPFGDSAELGGASNKWLNLFLSGVLNDGTNQISVAQMVAKQNSIIAGQDIVKNGNTISVDRTYIDTQIASAKDYTNKMIAKVVYGDIPTNQVDYFGYQNQVPQGVMPYASLLKIGGMSYKCNNLWWYQGAVGKTTQSLFQTIDISSKPLPAGTYTFSANVSTTSPVATGVRVALRNSTQGAINHIILPIGDHNPVTITFTTDCYYLFIYAQDDTTNNTYQSSLTNIMVNSGSTALPYEPYFEGIRDSAVPSIVSKNANDETLDTLTIDSNIQALDGYGWGLTDSVNNGYSYETKKYTQKVGRVDLGSLSWTKYSNNSFFAQIEDKKVGIVNAICSKYDCSNSSHTVTTIINEPNTIGQNPTNNYIYFYSDTTASMTAEQFETALSGVYLYFELATPVETDISQYIDDGFINVEENGSLIMENQYKQYVPSSILYIEEE